jgi:TolB-like protein
MIHCFEDCELDTTTFELRRDGRVCNVQPQVLELLRYLIENRERMVSKDELFEKVWSGRIVSESALSSRIKAARQAIGDDGAAQRLIRTVHGRGFRFQGDVTTITPSTAADDEPPAIEKREAEGHTTGEARRPAIAVLPLDNLSGDPEQEYFSDGITEDIITELSRFRSLRVIARNSSFTYKGRAMLVQAIGKDLGADYVVEGSVRKIGNTVRINAQLIETDTGSHVWAERYDRNLDSVFQLQDEITRAIAAAIEPEMGGLERQRSQLKSPGELDAWDWYQRGLWYMYQDTQPTNIEALQHFERAIELSPGFAPAYAQSAFVMFQDIIAGYRELSDDTIDDAFAMAEKAIAIDDRDALAHMVLGRLKLLRREYDESIAELETAIALNPSFADAHHALGFSLIYAGQPEEAIPHFETAIRLSPYDPRSSSFHEMRAWALLVMGRYESAANAARASVRRPNPQFWAFATLCAALGQLGLADEIKTAQIELFKRKPDFSVGFVEQYVYYNKVPEQLARYTEGLRKAGVPE